MTGAGEFALAEVLRRLAEQQQSLAQARVTAGTVITANSIATAFLASVALDDHSGNLPGPAWGGIAALLVAVFASLIAMRSRNMSTATSAEVLLRNEWANLEHDQRHAELARLLDESAQDVAKKLRSAWRMVSVAILATAATILCWTWQLARG